MLPRSDSGPETQKWALNSHTTNAGPRPAIYDCARIIDQLSDETYYSYPFTGLIFLRASVETNCVLDELVLHHGGRGRSRVDPRH